MKPKKTKSQRIVELERKLYEIESQLVHRLHFASAELDKFNTNRFAASAVILTLSGLGSSVFIEPVAIRGGLSKETIDALKADMVRSYEGAIALKPKGATT